MSKPQQGFDVLREFNEQLVLNQRSLFEFIHALVPNWSDAEDLLQETSRILWRKREQFMPGTSFRAWACQVARYEVLKHWQSKRRDVVQFSSAFIDHVTADVIARAETREAREEALRRCIEKLSAQDRQLILARYHEGLSVVDLADHVSRPVKSVYASLDRIRNALLVCIRRNLSLEGRP